MRRSVTSTPLVDRLATGSMRSIRTAVSLERDPHALNAVFNRISQLQRQAIERGESATIGQLGWRDLDALLDLLKRREKQLDRREQRKWQKFKEHVAEFGEPPKTKETQHVPAQTTTESGEAGSPKSIAAGQQRRRKGQRQRPKP